MKKLSAFLATVLTFTTLTYSQPSKATVGAIVSAPVLIAGLVITGASGIFAIKTISDCRRSGDNSGLCEGLTILITAPVLLVGLIVLDGEQGLEFSELNSKQAAELGVSEAELAVYNSEVDQANMILEQVKSELSQIKNADEADSRKAWSAVQDFVSPETFSTMQKIVSQK